MKSYIMIQETYITKNWIAHPPWKRNNFCHRLIVRCISSYMYAVFIFTTAEELVPQWHPFNLHTKLLRALHSKGFLEPTPIQKAALPIALVDRDVVGVAQTVS